MLYPGGALLPRGAPSPRRCSNPPWCLNPGGALIPAVLYPAPAMPPAPGGALTLGGTHPTCCPLSSPPCSSSCRPCGFRAPPGGPRPPALCPCPHAPSWPPFPAPTGPGVSSTHPRLPLCPCSLAAAPTHLLLTALGPHPRRPGPFCSVPLPLPSLPSCPVPVASQCWSPHGHAAVLSGPRPLLSGGSSILAFLTPNGGALGGEKQLGVGRVGMVVDVL